MVDMYWLGPRDRRGVAISSLEMRCGLDPDPHDAATPCACGLAVFRDPTLGGVLVDAPTSSLAQDHPHGDYIHYLPLGLYEVSLNPDMAWRPALDTGTSLFSGFTFMIPEHGQAVWATPPEVEVDEDTGLSFAYIDQARVPLCVCPMWTVMISQEVGSSASHHVRRHP
jgi:hypothetical protein